MPRKNEIHCNYLDRTTSKDYFIEPGYEQTQPSIKSFISTCILIC